MKQIICEMCGSTDLVNENGVLVCQSCGCRYETNNAQAASAPRPSATIALNEDVERLLQKCRRDPAKAKKYANLILEIEPHNKEALEILRR